MATNDELSRFSAPACAFVLQQFLQADFSASKVPGADTRLFQECAVPAELFDSLDKEGILST